MPVTRIARSHNLLDTAADNAESAIRSTQDATNDALDSLADSVLQMRHRSSPALEKAKAQANALAQRGLTSARDAAQLVRDRALNASDSTVGYIRDEPVKAVLIAAATGAVLMALANLISRARAGRRS